MTNRIHCYLFAVLLLLCSFFVHAQNVNKIPQAMVEGDVPPDNPQPQDSPQVESAQGTPRFFSFRKSWQDPPLRTNRQMFHSKLYVASQIGGAVAMIAACRNKRSGEDWGSEVPAVLGVDALAYLGGRFFTHSFAVGPGVYEMIHYSQAAVK